MSKRCHCCVSPSFVDFFEASSSRSKRGVPCQQSLHSSFTMQTVGPDPKIDIMPPLNQLLKEQESWVDNILWTHVAIIVGSDAFL